MDILRVTKFEIRLYRWLMAGTQTSNLIDGSAVYLRSFPASRFIQRLMVGWIKNAEMRMIWKKSLRVSHIKVGYHAKTYMNDRKRSHDKHQLGRGTSKTEITVMNLQNTPKQQNLFQNCFWNLLWQRPPRMSAQRSRYLVQHWPDDARAHNDCTSDKTMKCRQVSRISGVVCQLRLCHNAKPNFCRNTTALVQFCRQAWNLYDDRHDRGSVYERASTGHVLSTAAPPPSDAIVEGLCNYLPCSSSTCTKLQTRNDPRQWTVIFYVSLLHCFYKRCSIPVFLVKVCQKVFWREQRNLSF